MTKKPILILVGTTEGRHLAYQASQRSDVQAIASLAGRTRRPDPPIANTRFGGFGGVSGLRDYLQDQGIEALIDATHPFAAQISIHALLAAREVGIPHLRLSRPPWVPQPGDCWRSVSSNAEAAECLPEVAQRVFLTIGRQELATFASLQQLWFLMRMIDPPQQTTAIPPGEILLARGPFSLEDERSLLRTYQIGAIVSKNSGGEATYAKLVAAREIGIPVVMVQRPTMPEMETVSDIQQVLTWLDGL
ncbi:cobalt-precorrin-6A reductase [Phormidium yuhuli AB48]|uniref:Cobalt-precorrin-6A reductase n=1 Tax=Phormidium yuhuli AB48 TaxID=2940671 RepID=A0ABY5AVJ6_9CYAN|nr:cobalt-precorrin-6A reductase [Phormidium yuhuli]USR92133.1 cobalt-precorrin-6A reductase [Phormidium yuhuli AB48]